MSAMEDRIRQLCAEAIVAHDEIALERALSQLAAAIRVHVYHVRVMAAAEIPRKVQSRQERCLSYSEREIPAC